MSAFKKKDLLHPPPSFIQYDHDEDHILTLGEQYVPQLSAGTKLTGGILTLTDRYIYHQGPVYLLAKGKSVGTQKRKSGKIEISTIKGTKEARQGKTSSLLFGFAWTIYALYSFFQRFQDGIGSPGDYIDLLIDLAILAFGISHFVRYFLRRNVILYIIETGTKSLGVDKSWYSDAELEYFRQKIELVIDKNETLKPDEKPPEKGNSTPFGFTTWKDEEQSI